MLFQRIKQHPYYSIFAWAVAEATVFFILPDFFLLPLVVSQRQKWLKLTLVCLCGTISGTTLTYLVATHLNSEQIQSWLQFSLVSPAKMLKASNLVYEYGLAAFILQPFSFLPLKTLVINAAKSQLSFPLLLLCVFVGRASRNFLTAALALIIGKYFGKTIAQKPYLWLIAWAIFAGSIIAWSMTRV